MFRNLNIKVKLFLFPVLFINTNTQTAQKVRDEFFTLNSNTLELKTDLSLQKNRDGLLNFFSYKENIC